MSRLSIFLLGAPSVEYDDEPVKIDRRKAVALLAYLAITESQHSRDALATLLWPDYEPRRAYAYLRNALWILNRTPVAGWLAVDRESVGMERREGLRLDVARFRARLAAPEAHDHPASEVCADCLPPLAEAVQIYRDDFMAGFSLDDSAAFDEWQFFEAATLRDELAGALEKLVRFYGMQGEFEPAIAYARRWSALDPLDERVQRHLMTLYARSGQRSAALRQYEECARTLREELDLAPSEATVALHQRIRAGELTVAQRPASPASVPHNLPPQPTAFVGRETELAEIQSRLEDPTCRLLTIAGLGGSGKTRLALQAARQWLGAFSDGVFFVPLAPVGAPDFTALAVADALRAPLTQTVAKLSSTSQSGFQGMQNQLLDYLREKQMLLVLDNVEHLLSSPAAGSPPEAGQWSGAEGLIREILRVAPGVKLLLTSRERLNLRGEWVLEIAGLRYPPDDGDEVETYSAVRLFLQSARRAQGDFAPTREDLAAVGRICRLVQGVPLGVELAATWVKLLSSQEIANEIEANLDFLTTTLRDVPERHRSLRAVFEQSWALLPADGRASFRKLAVFRGGFTREAAQDVAGASLSALAALVDKSLLRRTREGRYEIHELLRQYAEERLVAVPRESDVVRDRHCEHYLTLLGQLEIPLKGAEQKTALERLRREVENVRAAWRWAVARDNWAAIHRATMGLFLFYDIGSRFQEGAEMFRAAATAAREQQTEPALLGLLMVIQAWFVYSSSLPQARELSQRGLAALEPLGPSKELAFANVLLAFKRSLSSTAEAKARLEESLAVFEAAADDWGVAVTLDALGVTLIEEDNAAAERYAQRGLELRRQLGDKWGMAMSLSTLAHVFEGRGELKPARERYQKSLQLRRELGEDLAGVVNCLNGMGRLARKMGDYGQARQLFRESLAIAKRIGNRWHIAQSTDNLGLAAYDLEAYGEARRHFETALALYQDLGTQHQTASALQALGTVALVRGDFEAARRNFEQSLRVQANYPWTLLGLGRLSAAQGIGTAAYQYYTLALSHAVTWRAKDVALKSLVGLAQLRLDQDAPEETVKLLGAVLNHRALSHEINVLAEPLLEKAAQRLSSETIEAALRKGQACTLETLSTELQASVETPDN